ncbi:MAG: hypothetical protein RLZ62_825 [Bacteroidota bacterium]|jgi:predicted patatin/cPLA2 family phospholipase
MTQREKTDVVFSGLLFGFLLFFGLLEEQKQQIARLRNMRKKLATENGQEMDVQNLGNDWLAIRNDLKTSIDNSEYNVK